MDNFRIHVTLGPALCAGLLIRCASPTLALGTLPKTPARVPAAAAPVAVPTLPAGRARLPFGWSLAPGHDRQLPGRLGGQTCDFSQNDEVLSRKFRLCPRGKPLQLPLARRCPLCAILLLPASLERLPTACCGLRGRDLCRVLSGIRLLAPHQRRRDSAADRVQLPHDSQHPLRQAAAVLAPFQAARPSPPVGCSPHAGCTTC